MFSVVVEVKAFTVVAPEVNKLKVVAVVVKSPPLIAKSPVKVVSPITSSVVLNTPEVVDTPAFPVINPVDVVAPPIEIFPLVFIEVVDIDPFAFNNPSNVVIPDTFNVELIVLVPV